MAKLKNRNLSNLTLYQLPFFSKIAFMCSGLGLTLLFLLGLIKLEEKMLCFLLLIVFILYDIMMFFLVFKTYIRMDFKLKTFVIREYPGFKEVNINLEDIRSIKITKNYQYKTFTIDILCKNNLIQIKSWSTGFDGFHLMFNNNYRQLNRLEKFCRKCNQYLEKNEQ